MTFRRETIVGVLYNVPVLDLDHPDSGSESDVVEVAQWITDSLVRSGFSASLLPASRPLSRWVFELESKRPDVVFNLIEGFAGQTAAEPTITGILSLLGIPYTGCPPESQSLCLSKSRTKSLLLGLGLPTAKSFTVHEKESIADALPFAGPYFVKPDAEDASLGIDEGSVIEEVSAVRARIEQLREEYGGSVVVEAYLPGAEFNVGVLDLSGPVTLPIAQVKYTVQPDQWPILTYQAKWDIGSAADVRSPIHCPAEIAPELENELRRLAIAAFRGTGCRDVARIDFRLDASGGPMILEVNPNPDLGPTAGWARALAVSDRQYDETIAALVDQALRRGGSRG